MKATMLHAVACIPPAKPLREGDAVAPRPNAEEPSDEALIANVARQDAQSNDALELLFVRHASGLQRFLARFTGRETDADDLVQDAFVRAAQKAQSFRGEGSFRTWLYSLALNLARTRMRRVALKERVDEAMPQLKPDLVRARPENDPSWGLEQFELREHLDAAISALAEGERETFLLYWFGELTYAEISSVTGVSISASKVRVHRALSRLAQLLEHYRE